MSACMKSVCGGVHVSLGIICLTVGLVIHFWLPDFIKDEIKKEVSVINTDSTAYKAFRNSTELIDIYEAFYVFHIENPWEVMNSEDPNKRIKVTQKGPFTFKLHKYKPEANTSWTTKGTVSYMQQTAYEFVKEKSADGFDTPYSVFRLGLFGGLKAIGNQRSTQWNINWTDGKSIISSVFADLPQALQVSIFNECLWKYGPKPGEGKHGISWQHPEPTYNGIVNITPRELFLGVTDDLLACAANKSGGALSDWLAINNQPVNSSSSKVLSAIYSGAPVSKKTPADQMPPPNSMNKFAMWHNMETLPFWNSTYANMINGTAGTQLEPGVAAVGHTPHIFVDTFYRSALIKGMEQVKIHGVDAIRYSLDPSTLDSEMDNPNNAAFYITTKGIQPSPPAKLLSPVYFSKPYYLDANTSAIKVDFLGPAAAEVKTNPEKYDVYLDFEPHSGVLLKVHKRLMISVWLEPYVDVPATMNWPTTHAPVFWADEYAEMSKSDCDTLYKELIIPVKFGQIGGFVIFGLGFLVFFIGAGCCYSANKTRNVVPEDTMKYYTGPTGNDDVSNASATMDTMKQPLNTSDNYGTSV